MSCVKRGCADPCFYCDAPVTRHEHDHAPVPQRANGTETVAACPSCHHLKDRMRFASWPLTLAVMAVMELAESDLIPDLSTASSWPEEWDDLSQHARVLWAKIAADVLDGEEIDIRRDLRLEV